MNKYTIGQKVYYIKDGQVACDIITGIIKSDKQHYLYSFEETEEPFTSVYFYYYEHSLFETKEKLIESLWLST